MTAEISSIVDAVLSATPTGEAVSVALQAPLLRTEASGDMIYCEGKMPAGAFEAIDFRQNTKTKLALLVLRARPTNKCFEKDLALDGYGERKVDLNPHIPPEGAISYTFRVRGVDVAFQFGAKSRVLRLVSFSWPEAKAS